MTFNGQSWATPRNSCGKSRHVSDGTAWREGDGRMHALDVLRPAASLDDRTVVRLLEITLRGDKPGSAKGDDEP